MAPSARTEEGRRLAARLRFRHLQLLVALQSGGSLRAAAQTLSFTQPALSKALAEIESAFGCALFTRTSRGLSPTGQGDVVLRGAHVLLHELEHIQQEVHSAEAATILRVGAPPFVAHGYLPPVLARLAGVHPRVRVELMEERVPLLLDALSNGKVDALVTSYPAQPAESSGVKLRYEKLFDAEFTVIAPAGHVLLRSGRIGWLALAEHEWILPARISMVRRLLEENFMRQGIVPPVPRVESTSPLTNVQLVAAGVGLSAVPAALVGHALAMKLVAKVDVTPPIPAGPVALISRAGPENPRLAMLRAALRSEAAAGRPRSMSGRGRRA